MKGRLWIEKSWMLGKWERILVVALLIGALVGTIIVVNGCTVVPRRRRRPRAVVVAETPGDVDVVYVQKAPPKARTEVRPKKPNKKAVWVPGHWQWNGRKYVWKAGHWDVRSGGEAWVTRALGKETARLETGARTLALESGGEPR